MRIAILGAVALIALAASGSAIATVNLVSPEFRQVDYPSPNYFTGLFTWNEGKGGIAWTSKPTTADPGGAGTNAAATATRGASSAVGWNLRTNTGGAQGKDLVVPETFEAAPFPRTVSLNVSRYIEVVLYKVGTECISQSHIDVELTLDGQFIGGGMHGMFRASDEPYVPGYCPNLYRFRPEVDRIHEGQVLKAHLLFIGETAPTKFGMGEGHWTYVRIPFYTDDEREDRLHPVSRKGELPEEPAGGPSGAALLLPISAIGWQSTRRGRKALLHASLVLAAHGSGCFGEDGGPASPPTETRDPLSVDFVGGGSSNASAGVLSGHVQDDLGLPVANAHAGLIGTDFDRTTDARGDFEMRQIPTGRYVLRIDAKGFHSLESPVEIRAGNMTVATVEVTPLVARENNFRPHIHDNWNGKTTLQLKVANDGRVDFEGTRPLGAPPAPYEDCFAPNVAYYSSSTNLVCAAAFSLEPGELVQPGTAAMNVTIRWDLAVNPVERVGFYFSANDEPGENFVENTTWMYPRANGEKVHIPMPWEFADIGHQKWSTWDFGIYVPTNKQGGLLTTQQSLYQPLNGAFEVEMSIDKGVVPHEPAHVDLWKGASTYEVAKRAAYAFFGQATANFPRPSSGWSSFDSVDQEGLNRTPPETEWLEIQLEIPNAGALPDAEWTLVYKGADLPPGTPVDQYKKLASYERSGGIVKYRFQPDPKENDAFYQASTQWEYLLDDQKDGSWTTLNTGPNPRTFYLTVIAHRDAFPG